jgi:hypothetical protein
MKPFVLQLVVVVVVEEICLIHLCNSVGRSYWDLYYIGGGGGLRGTISCIPGGGGERHTMPGRGSRTSTTRATNILLYS